MTTIKLYGELGKKFGQKHSFLLDKLKEFGSAMEANFSGFRQFFLDSLLKGKKYCLFIDGILMEDQTLLIPLLQSAPKEIVIVPLLSGAFYFIPAISTWAGTAAASGATAAGLGGAAGTIGAAVSTIVSMTLYAVVSSVVSSLFAPKPKSALQSSTANAGLNSYLFGGRENRAQQGTPVPIVYGELIIGTHIIQAGIRNLDKDDFEQLNNGDNTNIPTGTFI